MHKNIIILKSLMIWKSKIFNHRTNCSHLLSRDINPSPLHEQIQLSFLYQAWIPNTIIEHDDALLTIVTIWTIPTVEPFPNICYLIKLKELSTDVWIWSLSPNLPSLDGPECSCSQTWQDPANPGATSPDVWNPNAMDHGCRM